MKSAFQQLNPRQQAFVNGVTKDLKPASTAYADAYGGDKADGATQVKASQLIRNPKVVKTMEEVERDMHVYASEAFLRNITLASDPKTPANVKNDINKHIQGLGGMSPVQKTENTEMIFKGLNDGTEWLEEALKGIQDRKK